MMKNSVFLTAFNRPALLERTLETWDGVLDKDQWHFVFRIEPSEVTEHMLSLAERFIDRNGLQRTAEIIVNPETYGVLHHPWVGFEDLFSEFDFVVRAEDDLRVSNDILNYFAWASEEYRDRADVATVNAYSGGPGEDSSKVRVFPTFNPWVWGTWRETWKDLIGPTWDHDYSTFNGAPGHQSGWDWNLDTRIFPEHGLSAVFPEMSRVDNIGVYGVHGTPANHQTAATFRETYDVLQYQES